MINLKHVFLRFRIWKHEIELDQLGETNYCNKSNQYIQKANSLNAEYELLKLSKGTPNYILIGISLWVIGWLGLILFIIKL